MRGYTVVNICLLQPLHPVLYFQVELRLMKVIFHFQKNTGFDTKNKCRTIVTISLHEVNFGFFPLQVELRLVEMVPNDFQQKSLVSYSFTP